MSLTKPSRRPRKASYHHGDLEAAFLSEAKKLVARSGVENVSLRQVAANVGVSPSAAYHHFPDKEALLEAAARSAFEDMADFQEKALEEFSGTSSLAARRRFRALGFSYIGFARKNPNLFRLCFGPYCGGDVMAREETRPWMMLVNSLNELTAVGEVNPRMRPYAEVLVWSAVHGAANLVLDGLLPEEAVEPLIDSIELAVKGSGKVGK